MTQFQLASRVNLARSGEGDGVYCSRTSGPDGADCEGSVDLNHWSDGRKLETHETLPLTLLIGCLL